MVDFNTLTGSKKGAEDPAKWGSVPQEIKWMPHHEMQAGAFLQYCSRLSGIPVVSCTIDYRRFFYQFRTRRTEHPHTQMLVVVRVNGEYVFCTVRSKVMGMGFSPSSRVTQRFAHEYDNGLRLAFAEEHERILQTLPQPLIDLCRERAAHPDLGPRHAVLYWIATFTD